MTYKEITELIKTISKSNLSEFKYRNTEFEVTIRTENYSKGGNSSQAPSVIPVAAAPPVQHIFSAPPAAYFFRTSCCTCNG